jgi:hypothetical protein
MNLPDQLLGQECAFCSHWYRTFRS